MGENLKAMIADRPMLISGPMQYQSLTTKAICQREAGRDRYSN
jgi:hypothetical protein